MSFMSRHFLSAVLLLGYSATSAAQSQPPAQATDTGKTVDFEKNPLTGRALRCENGRIRSFECDNVELLAYLPRPTMGGKVGTGEGNDVWGWHDSTTGREFLIVGGMGVTSFVEVTDPINPKFLGTLRPRDERMGTKNFNHPQSVKVYQHYAFVGYEHSENGIQIFDLTQLRDVKGPPVVFQETARYDGVTRTHTLALNPETGFAYANSSNTCGSGLHMFDVRTPLKPTFAGCHATFPIHDTQCVVYRGPDQAYKGREICLSAGYPTGVEIADVTDKQAPKRLSSAAYPHLTAPHQGWLTEDHQYFFLDDEFDTNAGGIAVWFFNPAARASAARLPTRTLVFDVKDLDDPVLLTEYFHTTFDLDHNLYIRGRYMYQANYGAGLRIVDIIDPKQPKEVGYLTKIGKLAWGTYPYLKNDVVAVSTDTGLFLARLLKR